MNTAFLSLTDDKDDAAKFFASDKFKKLDAIIQAEVKRRYELVRDNPKSLKNLIELVKSGNFVDLKDSVINCFF